MSITRAADFSKIYDAEIMSAGMASSDITYHDGTGFHIYTLLSLTNDLSNPQDNKSAEALFEVVQRYADLVAGCLSITEGKILEVQGERLHIFVPGELNCQTAEDVATLCAALTNVVYDQKYRLGNTHFNGFKICLDYGRAIILKTGVAVSYSLISLGPCANDPAKHLSDVAAEHTAFSIAIAELLFDDVDRRKSWHEINLHDRKAFPSAFEPRRFNSIISSASSIDPVYQAGRFSVDANASFIPGNNRLPRAVFVQGLFLRADLDGFTSRVKRAFDDDNIEGLIQDFSRVIKYGDDFINQAGRPVIRIPWAGDCANMVILPKSNENIKDAKCYYPARGAHDWLSRYDENLEEPYQDAAWRVSICAGNDSTGKCRILIAPIEADGHKFLFAAGWGVGRSLDAQEQEGAGADVSLTSKEDYDDLEVNCKAWYTMLNSNFALSTTLKAIRKDATKNVPSLMARSHRVSDEIADAIPQPRPHWK